MKSLFLSFSITLFFLNGNAQEKQDFDFKCASIITSYNKEVTEYKFKSFEDLDLGLDGIIKELDFNGKEKGKKEECQITIAIRVEMMLGFATVVVSESITTNCNDKTVGMAANKLKIILTAIAID
jgi:hypothetical protein